MQRPYSQACENNKEPILRAIRVPFGHCTRVLELASGTGQHAAFFSAALPGIEWLPTDLPGALDGIRAWRLASGQENFLPPRVLDVSDSDWPDLGVDGVFAANLLHYVPWETVVNLFRRLAGQLGASQPLCVYGPFNYQGRFTSPSNEQFDEWLKSTDPRRGVRDFEAVRQLAADNGFALRQDTAMPANNRLIWWCRSADA